MRKLVTTTFLTLDGVMENPAWSFKYWNDDIAAYKQAELFASDLMLLGRVTYEGFAEAWPGRTDEAGYADKFNSMPKYVVSTTLENPTWTNSHVIRDNVVEEIQRLKAQEGGDILLHGSGTLIQTLIQHNLVDEYKVLLYPVVVGQGARLFRDGAEAALELVEARPIGNTGVVALTYRPEAGASGEE